MCGINYPNGPGYTKCRHCEGRLDYIDNATPHDDWQWRVDALKAGTPMREPEELRLIIEEVDDAERWFIDTRNAVRAGYNPEGWQPGDTLEACGFRVELMGRDRGRRRWWVEPIGSLAPSLSRGKLGV